MSDVRRALFHIQDSDRPYWVVATDWASALEAWREEMARQNPGALSEEFDPDGIQKVCEPDELLL